MSDRSDPVDMACALEEAERQRGIDAVLNRSVEDPEEDEKGNRLCKECGELMKKMRLMVMPDAVRCVQCQEMLEGGV